MGKPSKIRWHTATALVIANMIGTGVFTSLGFQLEAVQNTWSIILLWFLGAIMALCGALSYAELSSSMVRSGGEYHFLSQTYHPLMGYLSGWVSLTVGFAAPVALASMAFGEYLHQFFGVSKRPLAIGALLVVTLAHSMSLKQSGWVQNITTAFKMLVILGMIGAGIFLSSDSNGLDLSDGWTAEILLPGFAISFVYVTFSYSGWNAATYIAEEIKDPQKSIPKALISGTIIVSLLYVLLNVIFLKHSALASLQGQLEVGQVVAVNLFGHLGGEVISLMIGLILLSSISAMVWTGPRVTQVMGEDHQLWKWFSIKSANGIPIRAILLQLAMTLFLLLSGTFQEVLVYSGFVLQAFGALTVAAVFIHRRQKTGAQIPFRTPLYPLPQVIFLLLSAWVLLYLFYSQPKETAWGIISLAMGTLLYFADQKIKHRS